MAVWWAWMGFTWFANFFDVDDVPYRLLVLLMMFGSLALAAGVQSFANGDFRQGTLAYVVIRLSMATQWLRAARGNPSLAQYCYRWAVGICACQVFWVVFAFTRPSGAVGVPLFFVGMMAEVLVPVWAHQLPNERTPTTHREHVQERYGLFTLIVLGESILSGSDAFNIARTHNGRLGPLIVSSAFALVLAFAIWWIYFSFLGRYDLSVGRTAFIWGYSHYLIFASVAAVGASIGALLSDIGADDGHLPDWGQALTLAAPVAIFLAMISLLKWAGNGTRHPIWLVAAVSVLVIGTFVGQAGPTAAIIAVSATTAAFLAWEIVPRGKAAV
jgi:low temperature requirement protein LtrA